MSLRQPCTKKETLNIISYAVFMGLLDSGLYSETWEAAKTLALAIVVIVLRAAMLVLFPVTLPALYMFARHMQKGVIGNMNNLTLRQRQQREKLLNKGEI